MFRGVIMTKIEYTLVFNNTRRRSHPSVGSLPTWTILWRAWYAIACCSLCTLREYKQFKGVSMFYYYLMEINYHFNNKCYDEC
jgi:hypothetical protein